ncbi:MAG: hypothetical protein U5Q03_01985 [Bacteroidota bacterium]|nr:hypothetical protein [Bacteroidota bacterium]
MKKIILFLSMLLFISLGATAQTLSTTTFSSGNGNLPAVGKSTLTFQLDVTGIGDVVNMTIYLTDIDPEVVTYQTYANGIAGATFAVTPQLGGTRLMIEVNGPAPFQVFTVPDGKLVDIHFYI